MPKNKIPHKVALSILALMGILGWKIFHLTDRQVGWKAILTRTQQVRIDNNIPVKSLSSLGRNVLQFESLMNSSSLVQA